MKRLFFKMLFFLFVSCSSEKLNDKGKSDSGEVNIVKLSDTQFKLSEIKTTKLELKNISSTIRVNGKIDVPPQNLISVSAPLGGYLKETKLLPGMHIQKGEVIAVLEDQQYIQLQEEYLVTKIKLQTSEFEFQRQKSLNESKASSDKVFQLAKADYESTKIVVRALGEKLKLININPASLSESNLSKDINLYAPFDGFVSKVNVNIGKYITSSDVIFELVNPNDIHLNLKVFEKDLIQLSIGQKLLAYTNNHPEKKYKCEILEISKDISGDRTAEVHSHFDNYDKTLLPGMYMNAEVQLQSRNVLAVPESALVSYDTGKYLFVETEKNIFQMLKVEAGDSEDGFVEVVNAGEFKNKTIVSEGAYTLLMALKNKREE